MRTYVAQSGVRVTPEQLEMLVPAFDAAWATARQSHVYVLLTADEETMRNQLKRDEKALRDRLARIVVDLVMAGGMRAPEEVAEAAVARLAAETQH